MDLLCTGSVLTVFSVKYVAMMYCKNKLFNLSLIDLKPIENEVPWDDM